MIRELEDIVKTLENQVFITMYSSINMRKHMQTLNMEVVGCICDACFETKRWSLHADGDNRGKDEVCRFCPFWEHLLTRFEVGFSYIDSKAVTMDLHPTMGVFADRDGVLFHHGRHRYWDNVAYGKFLVHSDQTGFNWSKIKFVMETGPAFFSDADFSDGHATDAETTDFVHGTPFLANGTPFLACMGGHDSPRKERITIENQTTRVELLEIADPTDL